MGRVTKSRLKRVASKLSKENKHDKLGMIRALQTLQEGKVPISEYEKMKFSELSRLMEVELRKWANYKPNSEFYGN